MTPDAPPNGWVLYDDYCGFCRWWIPFWGPTLARAGYGWAPLQSDRARAALGGEEADLIRDLRLLRPDGAQLMGADVYRDVMRRVWWAYPLYIFSRLPAGRDVFNWGYRTFAENRYLVSRHCRLPGKTSRWNALGRPSPGGKTKDV